MAVTRAAGNQVQTERVRFREARLIAHADPLKRRHLPYRIYLVVVLGALLVTPLLFSFTGVLALAGQRWGTATLVCCSWATASALVILASIAPSYLGPLWSSRQEISYFLDGPFSTTRVAGPRVAAVFIGAAVLGTILATCLSFALGNGPLLTVQYAAIGAAFGAMICTAALRNQTAHPNTSRTAFVVLGGLLFAVSAVALMRGPSTGAMASSSAGSWWPTAVAGLEIIAMAMITSRSLTSITVGGLERDEARRSNVLQGVLIGDSRAFASQALRPRRWLRRVRFTPSKSLLLRTLQVDALGLLRRPCSTALGFVLTVLGFALVWLSHADPWLVFVALWLSHAALSSWFEGLRSFSDYVNADRPRGDDVVLAATCHVVLGTILQFTAAILGFQVASLAGGLTPEVWPVVVSVCVLAVCTRLWSLNGGAAPAAMMTPMPSPLGDMSPVMVSAWFARGLLPALVFLALAPRWGTAFTAAILAIAFLWRSILRIRRLGNS